MAATEGVQIGGELLATPFESYLLTDDRPDYPMTFWVELEFTGEVVEQAWRRALDRALERHPLLWSQAGRHRGRWRWRIPSRETVHSVPLVWGEVQQADNLPRLDVRSGPGTRFWVARDNGTVKLRGQFHHACCDGVGALQFYGDWLSAYVAELAGADRPVEWDPVRWDLLPGRGATRWRGTPAEVSLLDAIRGFVYEARLWWQRRPQPLAVPQGDDRSSVGADRTQASGNVLRAQGEKDSLAIPIVAETLSEEESLRLRRTARAVGATVNDWLLRDLFLVLAEWNRRHASSRPGWLVVTMPTNLRNSADACLPAANVIGYAFMARRHSDLLESQCSHEDLLAGLVAETKAIRNASLGNYFLDGLSWAHRIPGAMRWATRRGACHATAVFSNVGDPQRRMSPRLPRSGQKIVAGGLTLQRVIATPPVRPGTRAAFLATQSAGRLTLCVSHDRQTLPAYASQELLRAWLDKLRNAPAN